MWIFAAACWWLKRQLAYQYLKYKFILLDCVTSRDYSFIAVLELLLCLKLVWVNAFSPMLDNENHEKYCWKLKIVAFAISITMPGEML